MKTLICILFMFQANAEVPNQPKPTVLLKRVQTAYQNLGDLQGAFTQTYVDKLRNKTRTESGLLWAKKDGRVRWSYKSPVQKDFVYTGRAAYFYEPENAQVTVFEGFDKSPMFEALRFLWGHGQVTKHFSSRACTHTCPQADEDSYAAIELVPKKPIPTLDYCAIVVDTKTLRVKTAIAFDPLGNQTTYAFENMKWGSNVSDAVFDFQIPKGVSVIRATTPAEENKPTP